MNACMHKSCTHTRYMYMYIQVLCVHDLCYQVVVQLHQLTTGPPFLHPVQSPFHVYASCMHLSSVLYQCACTLQLCTDAGVAISVCYKVMIVTPHESMQKVLSFRDFYVVSLQWGVHGSKWVKTTIIAYYNNYYIFSSSMSSISVWYYCRNWLLSAARCFSDPAGQN